MSEPTQQRADVGILRTVRGQIAVVHCDTAYRPSIGELLRSDADARVRFEVYEYEGEYTIRCLILTGRTVERNVRLYSIGSPLQIPMGDAPLSRAINMFGEPEDGGPELKGGVYRSIHDPHRQQLHRKARSDVAIAETGIKAVDFFSPIVRGGSVGLVGGAGVGKTVLMTEMLRNFTRDHDGVTIFAGIGERTREAHELWRWLEEHDLLQNTTLVLGMINRNAGIRFRSAAAAAALAEYYRDERQQDVLFFVDNIFRYLQAGSELSTLLGHIPSEFGYQPTLQSDIAGFENRLASTDMNAVTSVQTLYVPADRKSDPAVTTTLPHLDSVISLSRDIVQQGRYPAIDPSSTNSTYMRREVVGDRHYDTATSAIEMLNQYYRLRRIVSIVGEAELSAENRTQYHRARQLINYMTQPFFSTESQTGRPGVYVPREQTVADVSAIINGQCDDTDTDAVQFIGSLSDR